MRRTLMPLWALPNALSMDTVLIAFAWQALLSKTLQNPLTPGKAWVLMLSTWLAYSGDRWLDSRHLKLADAKSYRHALCIRFRKTYFRLWCIVLITDIAIAWLYLSKTSLIAGTALLIVCLAYTICTQLRHAEPTYFKELSLAVIFALGVFVFVLTPESPKPLASLLFVLLVMLLWSNATLLAHWEREVDTRHSHGSLAQVAPWLTTHVHWLALGIGCSGLILSWLIPQATLFSWALAVSGIALFFIGHNAKHIPNIELRRCLADAALLSPWLMLF